MGMKGVWRYAFQAKGVILYGQMYKISKVKCIDRSCLMLFVVFKGI